LLANVLFVLILAGCSTGVTSVFRPRGPAAQAIADLGWLMIGIGGVVYVAVLIFLFYALFRRRPPQDQPQRFNYRLVLLGAGVVGPALILLVVFYSTIQTIALTTAENQSDDNLVVHVTGNQFWWEVSYPDLQITTANEIHIPVNTRVDFKLTSEDVIHSFWVPELHGKLDLVPGQTNSFWIEASETGTFFGECAEFCGIQHAKMQLLVIAQDEQEFQAWVEQMQQPAPEPASDTAQAGLDVFLSTGCANCHTIQGTEATGELGPDLTHLASRQTIAANTLPNNRGNLGGWIVNPQNIKPGALMPPTELVGDELTSLLEYLSTLE
jgi:cytochrome c oxidase subunit 2